jgi:AcrR family transcriptional regulator
VAAQRISRADVVATARLLVDRDGWQRLTMTDLATKLGVRVQTLYSHVANVEDVLRDVQVAAHAELANLLQRAAMGKARADGFRALAATLRDYARDHRGLYHLAMTAPIDADAVAAASEPSGAALRAVIESFDGPAPTLQLQMKCLALVHGVLALEAAGLYVGTVDEAAVYDEVVALTIEMLDREGAR